MVELVVVCAWALGSDLIRVIEEVYETLFLVSYKVEGKNDSDTRGLHDRIAKPTVPDEPLFHLFIDVFPGPLAAVHSSHLVHHVVHVIMVIAVMHVVG